MVDRGIWRETASERGRFSRVRRDCTAGERIEMPVSRQGVTHSISLAGSISKPCEPVAPVSRFTFRTSRLKFYHQGV